MKLSRRIMLHAAVATAAQSALAAPQIATVAFGPHRISRLIVGGNPVSGFSHWSPALDQEMLDYHTAAKVKALLRQSEAAGITVWQSRGDRYVIRMLREYRNEGGRIQWIAQTASEFGDINRNIREIAGAGAIAAYHHGSSTDAHWRSGKFDVVRERLKVMRDAGLRAGVGTHTPEVIDEIESRGWDVDFYMTCLYNLSRTREEAAQVAGRSIEGEYFHEPDREAMLQRVRATKRQCLIFKVYGAGRHCRSLEDKQAALRHVRESAKPEDCLVIGMYQRNSDQVAENRLLFANEFTKLS